MCLTPDIDVPEPEEPKEENELLITDEEEEKALANARMRGTQGLQIGLNTGASKRGGGLAI